MHKSQESAQVLVGAGKIGICLFAWSTALFFWAERGCDGGLLPAQAAAALALPLAVLLSGLTVPLWLSSPHQFLQSC